MGRKYFISDTHIGERGELDDFNEKEKNFRNLLRIIINQNSKEEPGELILLGDFFDFLEVRAPEDRNHLPEKKVALIFDKIKSHYGELFKAIKEYIMAGQKIFYVCGNHDYQMLYPKIFQTIVKEMVPEDITLVNGHRLFQVNDCYISWKYQLYAEHGHRFDNDNWHHNGMYECFGSLLVKEYLRKWEQRYPMLDNLRPRGQIYYVIQDLADSPDEVQKEMLGEMLAVHDKYLGMCKAFGYYDEGAEDRRNDLALATGDNIIKKLVDFIDEHIIEGKIVKGLNENCTTYREMARKLMNMNNPNNIASQKDLNFQPRYFVLGHTHFFDYKPLDIGYYYNTASWLDTVVYDRKDTPVANDNELNTRVSSTDENIAQAPVLVFNHPGDAKPVLYDVPEEGDLNEIDFDDIAARYKTLKVKF